MKRIYLIAAALPILALGLLAQDNTAKQIKFFFRGESAVMGPAVKGAPYSAEEVTESTQVLADGTRIHNESKTLVYRDGEGRVRRDGPDQITIWDPVAGASYFLDPKAQTARKVPVGIVTATGKVGAVTMTVTTSSARTKTITVNGATVSDGTPPAEALAAEKLAAEKVEIDRLAMPSGLSTAVVYTRRATGAAGNKESLGTETMEGVNAEGSRTTSTIGAGEVGNDRPIQIVSERWYSPELQTVVMTRINDPRTGEEVFRLANIHRAEPGAYLFQVPAGYQMVDQKDQK
jgi:hypothetical protein